MKFMLFCLVILVAIFVRTNGQDECTGECIPTHRPVRVPIYAGIDACDQPEHYSKRRGKAFFPRFYYNKNQNECQSFIFGGGVKTENNFETQEACETRCVHAAEK